ncbi:hypothetical protein HBNXHr_1982 [Halorhabdus sp. BNX81]|nr:hypothetical protein HBNXHr_1982 [Halorhabdus sp. BNX81]
MIVRSTADEPGYRTSVMIARTTKMMTSHLAMSMLTPATPLAPTAAATTAMSRNRIAHRTRSCSHQDRRHASEDGRRRDKLIPETVPESAANYTLGFAIGNETFVTWPVETSSD